MNEFDENMTAYVRYRLGKAEETFDFSKEDVDSMMEPAKKFITCVCDLIDLP